MSKSQKLTIIISLVIAIVIVSAALVFAAVKHNNDYVSVAPIVQRPVTHAELTEADGKNGHICYVAVSGVVYQIKDSALWSNGQHTPSGGLAYCGADLTNVIDEAPHGRGILNTLPMIGPLVP